MAGVLDLHRTSMAVRQNSAAWGTAALCLAVLCGVFAPEIGSAIAVWNSSTAYGHCWLVLPIAGWLLWERRAMLCLTPSPIIWPVLPALVVLWAWIAADWLGIMEGRQLALVGFVLLLLLAALGSRLWWALSAAFLYLVFLVPFGAFVTPALQQFTAWFIAGGLRLLDVPFEADTFQITIPEGVFYVAEACAGLRFLIASVAFGVLYSVTMFRSPWRRAAFVAVACVVPVLANGVRGLGIVLLGHALGSAQAAAADHVVYGLVFFSAVIVLLAFAGLPFRQTLIFQAPARLPGRAPAGWPRALAACLPVLVVAAAGPVASRVTLARPASAHAIVPSIAVPARCTSEGTTVRGPVSSQAYRCAGRTIRVTTTALPFGANPNTVLDAARTTAADGLGSDLDGAVWRAAGAPWMLLSAADTGRVSAYAVWINGRQSLGGLRDRLILTKMGLGGTGRPAVAVAVTIAPGGQGASDDVKSFLAVQTRLTPSIVEAIPARPGLGGF